MLPGTCCSQWMGMIELWDFKTSECASIFQTKSVLRLHCTFCISLERKNAFRCETRFQMKNDRKKSPKLSSLATCFWGCTSASVKWFQGTVPTTYYRLTFKFDAFDLQCCGSDCLSTLPNIGWHGDLIWFHCHIVSFESQGCLTFVFLKAHQFQCVAVWSHLRYNDSDYCSMIWLLLLSKRYATSVGSWRKQKNFLSHDCKWFIAKKSNFPYLMILISHWQKPKNNN